MTLNDVLLKQNVLNEVVLNEKVSTPTKVKVIRLRAEYSKIKQAFDEDLKNFAEQVVSQEMKDLAQKENRTEEETAQLEEYTKQVNIEYQEYILQKGNEEVSSVNDTFTLEEYSELLEANVGRDVEINGNTIKSEQFLEILYSIFVK